MERRLFFYISILFCLFTSYQAYPVNQDSLRLDSLKKEGTQLARNGDFDGAEKLFLYILEEDSNYFEVINNLSNVYKLQGRYNAALEGFQRAEDILISKCGDTCRNLLAIYINIGVIYNVKQDYELALQYFNSAERIVHLHSLKSTNATSVYNNIGNYYYFRKLWRVALDYYKKGMTLKKQYNAIGLGISYANVAGTFEEMGLLDSAEVYYRRSIQAKIDFYNSDSYHLINVYDNYGLLLQKLGKYDESLQYLNNALDLADSNYIGKHPNKAECYIYLGRWYLEMNEPEMALEYFHNAILNVVFDFDDKDVFSNPSLESEILSEAFLLDALRRKAKALMRLYENNLDINKMVSSLETLEKANLLSEKMRSSYQGQESKLFITESSHESNSEAMIIAYDLFQLTGEDEYANKTFQYAEKSKSSVLLASLQEVETKKNLNIPASIQSFEEDLKSQIEVNKKKLYEERQRENPDSEKLGKWQSKLIVLSQQLDSINNKIRTEWPEYTTKYTNEVVDLEDVKKALKRDQVLLEYAFTDTSMFLFFVESNEHNIYRIPIDTDFYTNVEVLSQFLRDNDFANNTYADYQAYTAAAYFLYNVLISPVEDKITGKKLIIIPDGELGYIPFESLLTSPVDGSGMDYRSLPYLIYKFSTNYSYSATLLLSEKIDQGEPERPLLAFAPTYEHVGDIKGDKFPAYRDYSSYLVPLRFISQEIENISNIMDCDKYEDFEATEAVFRERAPHYDILHLAMHTLINDENPMYSQLVFTLNNDTLEDNDGLLNTYELFNIKLSARMAVLSACNTGYGQLRKGEGIMSLARGFIFAGVPSIIMTLWAVEDQSGSILMSRFYENLVDGLDIDAALRESKLQYLQNADQLGAHPYLWSGYVSIGSTQPLVRTSNGLYYVIAGGALLALVFVFLFFRSKKKRA